MTTADAKRRMGERARELRRSLFRDNTEAAAACGHVMACLAGDIGLAPGAVVAGYWPRGDELDVRDLLQALHGAGYGCALPVVTDPGRALAFRRWRPGGALKAGRFGIMEPAADAATVVPDMVIAPLLAFDRSGYRLGYGAGYYDRTLRELRRAGRVVAAGIGFEGQRVDSVPHDESDERLDWVVTETGAVRIDN